MSNTQNSDELIESFINGNSDYIAGEFKKMSYIEKDKFITDIKSNDLISGEEKLDIFIFLLKKLFN